MKKTAICHLSVVAVRAEANDRAEIVTQLLFGELLTVLRVEKLWAKIRCDYDGYEGWIDSRQMTLIAAETYLWYQQNPATMVYDMVQPIMGEGHFLPLTLGATLPLFDGIGFQLGENQRFTFAGQAITPSHLDIDATWVVKVARRYLYAPYLWGGRSPFGIDCSGLTQMVYKILGIRLKRDAYQQAEEGELVAFVSDVQAGDLAFFDNEKGKITHVGIVIDEHHILHASGQVRIDKLDHYGIFNIERDEYTHRLRLIRRLMPLLPDPSILLPAKYSNAVNKNQILMF